MKKLLSIVLSVVLAAGLLAGCSSSSSGSTSTASQGSTPASTASTDNGEKKVIRVAWWGGQARACLLYTSAPRNIFRSGIYCTVNQN